MFHSHFCMKLIEYNNMIIMYFVYSLFFVHFVFRLDLDILIT